ncbi:MAG: LamG domain-containing protein [Planctomycetota bacterium]|jgi:hypothetical protein
MSMMPISRSTTVVTLLGLSLLGLVPAAYGQCQLANPSFEVNGGGTAFGGWNQFGNITAVSTNVTHGNKAVRIAGPDESAWGVSAVWQRLDSAPGEYWRLVTDVGHNADAPLNGNLQAIINIEWRDGSNQLIDFESFSVADANTTPDVMNRVEITSSPAPAGTAAIHVLMAVLQSPAQEPGYVYYDLVSLEEQTSPGLGDLQWGDFPGGRTLDFGGHSWRVKGPGFYGPGPNSFSDEADNVWVDGEGNLHMTCKQEGGTWYSTEIATEEVLGYGDYKFTAVGRLDTWDPNIVFGYFLWQYPFCYNPGNPWNLHNEVDVEISRWGDPQNDLAQFVVQPYDVNGNIYRFPVEFESDDELTSFAYRWLPDRMEFRAWKGGLADESPSNMIESWTYTGPHLPRPEFTRMHLNLWYAFGPPGQDHEIVISDFQFVGEGGQPIPAVGEWGLAILLLGIMIAGTTMFRRSTVSA